MTNRVRDVLDDALNGDAKNVDPPVLRGLRVIAREMDADRSERRRAADAQAQRDRTISNRLATIGGGLFVSIASGLVTIWAASGR